MAMLSAIGVVFTHLPAGAGEYHASVAVRPPASPRAVSPWIWGVNLETRANGGELLPLAATAKAAGVRMYRFMGGCSGDLYDWKRAQIVQTQDGTTHSQPVMSIDDALRLADATGAELLYELNVETKGLPNPCDMHPAYPGLSEEENTRILLADARDLMTSYGSRLRYVELGNEPWGSWKAEEYAQVARRFARELKSARHDLTILAVGHPSTGNNMSESIPESRSDRDRGWTSAVQALRREPCGDRPCVDILTDHPYVFAGYDPEVMNDPGNFEGLAAWYAPVMYRQIFRNRMTDYDGGLAVTEWNVKNWATGSPRPIPLENPGFESGGEGWIFRCRSAGSGQADLVTSGAARGERAMRLTLNAEGTTQTAELMQRVSLTSTRRFRLTARVRVSEPAAASVYLSRTRSDEAEEERDLTTSTSLASLKPGVWQSIRLDGRIPASTTSGLVLFRVTRPASPKPSGMPSESPSPTTLTLEIDDVLLLATDGWNPAMQVSGTVEHGLFVLESLLEMAEAGVTIANYHNFGLGTGSLFASAHTLNPAGEAFALTSVIGGGRLADHETSAPELRIPQGWCTSLHCLKGNVSAPYLGTYAAVADDGTSLTLYLINRHPTDAAQVALNLNGFALPADPVDADCRTLSGNRYTDTQFQKHDYHHPISRDTTVSLPPISATRMTVPLGSSK